MLAEQAATARHQQPPTAGGIDVLRDHRANRTGALAANRGFEDARKNSAWGKPGRLTAPPTRLGDLYGVTNCVKLLPQTIAGPLPTLLRALARNRCITNFGNLPDHF